MDDINIRIAHRIRELRLARGYTLDVLAARCQVSRSAISLIERGETSPTAVVLEKLANGLEVPLTQILRMKQGIHHLNRLFVGMNKLSGEIRNWLYTPYSFTSELKITLSDG